MSTFERWFFSRRVIPSALRLACCVAGFVIAFYLAIGAVIVVGWVAQVISQLLSAWLS